MKRQQKHKERKQIKMRDEPGQKTKQAITIHSIQNKLNRKEKY